jgi:hypothetical protein
MSPAAIPEELQPQPQPDLHQDQLQAVGKAFDALLLTLFRLTHRHNDLKQYTEEAFKQVLAPFFICCSSISICPSSFHPHVSNDERI